MGASWGVLVLVLLISKLAYMMLCVRLVGVKYGRFPPSRLGSPTCRNTSGGGCGAWHETCFFCWNLEPVQSVAYEFWSQGNMTNGFATHIGLSSKNKDPGKAQKHVESRNKSHIKQTAKPTRRIEGGPSWTSHHVLSSRSCTPSLWHLC